MYLVQAFEKLVLIQKIGKKATKWALPGLQPLLKAPETQVSSSSFFPSNLFLTVSNRTSNKGEGMITEEERQRIPIAQGLPWTTDEAECLLKPLVKEITIPKDLKLHSDMWAIEQAKFDHQKMSLFEQYKMERERLLKVKSYCT
ncbi:caldesmon [Pyrus ussuriensis x Pyrus communis]|uniref:Caldesmon n=1 Tax=Pyrus ussuriensis x Pyrus communis TaxID=2448454 RepID=A0A5N5GJV0_9ROSA|nr:caldesmon [Pyrus ussuriensis x Pyrus communis]